MYPVYLGTMPDWVYNRLLYDVVPVTSITGSVGDLKNKKLYHFV